MNSSVPVPVPGAEGVGGLLALPDQGAAVTLTNVDCLADDLLLLAVRGNGTLAARGKLRFGVAAAELIQLAARGSVDISDSQITVLDSSSTGDPLLDDALASMTTGATAPSVKIWVGLNRPGLTVRHLAALMAAGTIREGQRKVLGLFPDMRLKITDPERQAQARARLDAIASGASEIGPEQAALAGLADAVGLAAVLYRGDQLKRVRAAAHDDQVATAAWSAGKRKSAASPESSGAGTQGFNLSGVFAVTGSAHYVAHHPPAYGSGSGGIGGSGHHGGAGGGGHHHGGGFGGHH